MHERKPLELTVYPKGTDPYGTPVYLDGGEFGWRESDVDRWARAKHLTGPELAAEFWRVTFLHENSLAQNDGYDGATETVAYRRQWMTLNRFATHDHYDQEDQ